jgi:hypothetical protein
MDLVSRVKNILIDPVNEWRVIDGESGDGITLLKSYVAVLAAIPVLCGFIGSMMIGGGIFAGLVGAIVSYLLTFVGVYVLAFIVYALAPSFGGRKDFPSALKLVVYSATASWVAGIFLLIPALAVLSLLLGLYSLYLLYLGIPVLMRAPADKSLVYTIVVVVCAAVVWILIGTVPTMLLLGSRF